MTQNCVELWRALEKHHAAKHFTEFLYLCPNILEERVATPSALQHNGKYGDPVQVHHHYGAGVYEVAANFMGVITKVIESHFIGYLVDGLKDLWGSNDFSASGQRIIKSIDGGVVICAYYTEDAVDDAGPDYDWVLKGLGGGMLGDGIVEGIVLLEDEGDGDCCGGVLEVWTG